MKDSKIISISLDENTLKKLYVITEELEHKGRSETIRNAINLLDTENKNIRKLKGNCNCVLLVVHSHSKSIERESHKIKDLIKTHLHNHLDNKDCLEIFLLKGLIEKIHSFAKKLNKDKKVKLTKIIII